MKRCRASIALALALCALTFASLAPAARAGSDVVSPVASPVPANYCISCHSAAAPPVARAGDWRGSVAPTSAAACPGLRAVDEQRHYVERQLLANSRLGGHASAALDESYARLLDLPLTSADAFEAEAQLLSYQGGKTYATLNQRVEAGKRLRVLIAALAVTAFLLFAFGWGLRNTLKAQPAQMRGLWRPGPSTFAALVLVLILFALPLFRAPPAADATSSTEEQAAQAELDTSSRAAAVAERAYARAAVLGETAALWAKFDRPRGEQILAEALAAEAAARQEADALWGRAQAAEEAAVGSAALRDKAGLVTAELLAVRSRAWGLRAIAERWAPVDPARAQEILAAAEAVARSNTTIYGAFDLRAIAQAWAALDPARIVDLPAPQPQAASPAAAGAEAATLAAYAAANYGQAWETSAGIADEWERARAQAAIAAAWLNRDAASGIGVPALRDRALREIAASTADTTLSSKIASPYQRVMALVETGRAADAVAQAGELSEKAPLAQVAVSLAPAQPADALGLVDQLPRESDKAEALMALALATGDPAVFDRALSMAAAARVRGDALAPARASLALARGFMDTPEGESNALAALSQAYELASKVSVKYK